jgi:hypothetical protein
MIVYAAAPFGTVLIGVLHVRSKSCSRAAIISLIRGENLVFQTVSLADEKKAYVLLGASDAYVSRRDSDKTHNQRKKEQKHYRDWYRPLHPPLLLSAQ